MQLILNSFSLNFDSLFLRTNLSQFQANIRKTEVWTLESFNEKNQDSTNSEINSDFQFGPEPVRGSNYKKNLL